MLRRRTFVVGLLSLSLCLPVRVRAADPATSLPEIIERVQHLDAAQINQLSNSALALLAAVTTLWSVRSHLSNIRGGVSDVWNFRANRELWKKAEVALADFRDRVMRETADKPDGLFYRPPSIVLEFVGHLEKWLASVKVLDDEARAITSTYEEVRLELAYHLRFGLVREVPGMEFSEHHQKAAPLIDRWEKHADAHGLEEWIDEELTGSGFLVREEAGVRWLRRYIRLQQRLAAAEWLEKRTSLHLKTWFKTNDPRGNHLSYDDRQWWKRFTDGMIAEAAAAQAFSNEYNNLMNQLNRLGEPFGKRYPVMLYEQALRDAGMLHESDAAGAGARLHSSMDGQFRGYCGTTLAAYEGARDDAAKKGTWPGILMTATARIFTPAALIATGVTTAILAYQGFSVLLKKILLGI